VQVNNGICSDCHGDLVSSSCSSSIHWFQISIPNDVFPWTERFTVDCFLVVTSSSLACSRPRQGSWFECFQGGARSFSILKTVLCLGSFWDIPVSLKFWKKMEVSRETWSTILYRSFCLELVSEQLRLNCELRTIALLLTRR